MKYEFETMTIGDCCDIIKKSIYPEKGQVYTCFSLPAFDNSNTPEILNGEEIKSSKFVLDENTILFNKLNPKFRRVWNIHSLEKYENTICSTEFLPLKAKANIEQDYLYYYISSPYFTRLMDGIRTGTSNSQQRIDWKQFLREQINVPSLPIQRKVVSLLSNIDKKIKLNNKINNNLEQQAQAIYQQMFIDNASSDWTEGTLSDIADITMGQSPSGSSYNEDGNGTIFFQGRAEFGFRFPSVRLYTTEPKRMACANDTLMSVRAPVGDLNVAHTDCCIGRGLAAIHSKNNHQSFVLYTMFYLKKQLDVFNGEGTVFGSINRNSLNEMPILIPSSEKLDEFEALVAPMDAAIHNNYDEICRLEQLRDSLLPQLMSGELDVSDIDL